MKNQFRTLVVVALRIVLLFPVVAILVPDATILPDNLAMLCPGVDVCPEKITTEWNDTYQNLGDFVACCTECSCDETCVLTNNCCFPPSDLHPDSTCLFPSTEPSTERNPLRYKSYRMVDRDATKISSSKTPNASCSQIAEKIPCGEKAHPPFGSLLPVFSKKMNKIYKNPSCAASHDVSDSLVWQSEITCQNPLHPQASSIFQMLEYGFIPEFCFFRFVYPGKESDLDLHACHRDKIQTCNRDSFTVPERLNMSASQVRAVCESGFISPGPIQEDGPMYGNVFCDICNNGVPSKYTTTSKYCKVNNDNMRGTRQGLSYLINTTTFGKEDPKSNAIIPEVCDDNQGIMNSNRCRELKCPTNQFRNHNGNCEYMLYSNDNAKKYFMVINVHVDGFYISTNSSLNQALDDLIKLWTDINPWPQQGDIRCELDAADNNGHRVKSMYVGVRVSPRQNMPFQTFLRNVKTYLNKKWAVKLKGLHMKLHQSIAKFSEIYYKSNTFIDGYVKALPGYYKKIDSADLIALNITEPLMIRLRYSGTSLTRDPFVVYLTKLYFCEQIELQPHEFTLYKSHRFGNYMTAQALFYNSTGKLMFENEFVLISKPNQEIVARICLSDSVYKRRIVTSGAGSIHACQVLVVYLVYMSLRMTWF